MEMIECEKESCAGASLLEVACKREFRVKTVFDSSSYRFKWDVERYSNFPVSVLVDSPVFNPAPNLSFKGQLKKDYYRLLYIYITKISGNDTKVSFTVTIRKGCESVEIIKDNNVTLTSSSGSCEVCKVVGSQLDDLVGDVLFIDIQMELFHSTFQTKILDPEPLDSLEIDSLFSLSDDMKLMYAGSLYNDTSLLVGSTTVTAHKAILCSRSPVFKKMFESSLDESATNVIVIKDLDLPTLNNLLTFLYTGRLSDENFASVIDVYYAADKYDVPSLRKLCAQILLSKLEIANSCEVMELADRHSDLELKDSTMKFVSFHFDLVLETEAWRGLVLQNAALASEVMSLRNKKRKMCDINFK